MSSSHSGLNLTPTKSKRGKNLVGVTKKLVAKGIRAHVVGSDGEDFDDGDFGDDLE